MAYKLKKQTIVLDKNPVSIKSFASVVGKKESQGPLKNNFDIISEDTKFGENTWEKAESKMQELVLSKAIEKANISNDDVDLIFAGDLLNQCTASSFCAKKFDVPFLGLYGACSTMAETLLISSVFVDSGSVKNAVCMTSSHFCTAERQFRLPLEYGGQRPPYSQWTVTGSGAIVLSNENKPPYITKVCPGKIEDLGIKDANNMGAAMAPAAASVLNAFLEDTNTSVNDYDLILTGDLGRVGSDLLYELMDKKGIDIRLKHQDCGLMIYDIENQDVHAGGSGCGCAGSVLTSTILKEIKDKKLNKVLFMATGALLSPTSTQQGQVIPCIAHLIEISNSREGVS